MEKRVLLAIFLSFLVLYFYQSYLAPPPPAGPRPGATEGVGEQPPVAGGTPEATSPSGSPVVAAPKGTEQAAVAPTVSEEAERTVVVETAKVRATFSNRGGVITSWQLKDYKDDAGRLVDLVPQGMPPGTTKPLALTVDDTALTARLRTALFQMKTPAGVDATRKPVTLEFEYQDRAGLRAVKTVRLDPQSYVMRVSASVDAGNSALNPTIEWGPGLGDALKTTSSSYEQKPQGILYRNGKIERLDPSTLEQAPVQEAQFRYVGVDDQYFIAALLPERPARVVYEPVAVPVPGQDPANRVPLVAWGVRVAEGASEAPFFYGPKNFDVLRAVDPEFVRVINFGIFAWLAVPLLRALNGINEYVGNYGWSIIILTVIINLVMFPLRHKSVVSMRKMQEIQPQVKEIQARYSKLKTTDPARQKMNAELMNLYREKGVNPASGCIPMLLTFPVLFAFYSLLGQAIEIRGAPFALWITDLAAHDPYYVTPVIMGATMVWQQKITPSTVDPAQQKMMMLMPVVFMVMFLWAPSGLVIYWLVSNLAAIGQQYVTNRIAGPPDVRERRPPAERRLRRVGGGRTSAVKNGE